MGVDVAYGQKMNQRVRKEGGRGRWWGGEEGEGGGEEGEEGVCECHGCDVLPVGVTYGQMLLVISETTMTMTMMMVRW